MENWIKKGSKKLKYIREDSGISPLPKWSKLQTAFEDFLGSGTDPVLLLSQTSSVVMSESEVRVVVALPHLAVQHGIGSIMKISVTLLIHELGKTEHSNCSRLETPNS